jgi:thymidylate synthase ThyX
VFFEYGDDSVAQLGGVHLACEQASNLLTKILEWGRLMSYLEQSTRYIAYDSRLGGRYRFHRDPEVLASPLGTRYVGDMDRMFDAYSEITNGLTDHVRSVVPQGSQ